MYGFNWIISGGLRFDGLNWIIFKARVVCSFELEMIENGLNWIICGSLWFDGLNWIIFKARAVCGLNHRLRFEMLR